MTVDLFELERVHCTLKIPSYKISPWVKVHCVFKKSLECLTTYKGFFAIERGNHPLPGQNLTCDGRLSMRFQLGLNWWTGTGNS